MIWFDEHHVQWQRCTDKFPYVDSNGKARYYHPDFYLPQYYMYIEAKGMIRKNDPLKFAAFPSDKTLVLVGADEMQQLGIQVFNPAGHRAPGNGWPNKILDQIDDYSEVGQLDEALAKRLHAGFDILLSFVNN